MTYVRSLKISHKRVSKKKHFGKELVGLWSGSQVVLRVPGDSLSSGLSVQCGT